MSSTSSFTLPSLEDGPASPPPSQTYTRREMMVDFWPMANIDHYMSMIGGTDDDTISQLVTYFQQKILDLLAISNIVKKLYTNNEGFYKKWNIKPRGHGGCRSHIVTNHKKYACIEMIMFDCLDIYQSNLNQLQRVLLHYERFHIYNKRRRYYCYQRDGKDVSSEIDGNYPLHSHNCYCVSCVPSSDILAYPSLKSRNFPLKRIQSYELASVKKPLNLVYYLDSLLKQAQTDVRKARCELENFKTSIDRHLPSELAAGSDFAMILRDCCGSFKLMDTALTSFSETHQLHDNGKNNTDDENQKEYEHIEPTEKSHSKQWTKTAREKKHDDNPKKSVRLNLPLSDSDSSCCSVDHTSALYKISSALQNESDKECETM